MKLLRTFVVMCGWVCILTGMCLLGFSMSHICENYLEVFTHVISCLLGACNVLNGMFILMEYKIGMII